MVLSWEIEAIWKEKEIFRQRFYVYNLENIGLESREYGRRDPLHWPRGIFYPKKLALTLPTSGGIGAQATESFYSLEQTRFYGQPFFIKTLILMR
jgi:hypothetical protein